MSKFGCSCLGIEGNESFGGDGGAGVGGLWIVCVTKKVDINQYRRLSTFSVPQKSMGLALAAGAGAWGVPCMFSRSRS